MITRRDEIRARQRSCGYRAHRAMGAALLFAFPVFATLCVGGICGAAADGKSWFLYAIGIVASVGCWLKVRSGELELERNFGRLEEWADAEEKGRAA